MIFLYYPPFSSSDSADDHIYRLSWYLHPLLPDMEAIVLPYTGTKPTIGAVPPTLDASLEGFFAKIRPYLKFVSVHREPIRYLYHAARCDYVMLWKIAPDIPNFAKPLLLTKHKWRVDHHRERYAGSFYLKASSEFDPTKTQVAIAASTEKFSELVAQSHYHDKSYIFGTGPNLAQVMNRDFSDGITIACNSMLKNRALMEKLSPNIITMADPIFHAGASRYAGRFRQYLRDALEVFDSYLIVPMRDFFVYKANLEPQYTRRLIGVPFLNADQPNLELTRSFHVTTTANIMTLFLIPLACTLSQTISMAGFDGRAPQEDDLFWKHDPASQITDEMQNIQEAHPAFFQIDYATYYQQHCDTLAIWLDTAETQGKQLINTTPSYIPALQHRS